MSENDALKDEWTTIKTLKKWVMGINWNKISYHNVPKEYLKYAVIQETLCPDMTNWFDISSIKEEIKTIPENIYDNYLEWRISFFEKMQEYRDQYPDPNNKFTNYTNTYSKNIWKIIEYLKTL